MSEAGKLEFRSEFFNIFNHPQFANPAVTPPSRAVRSSSRSSGYHKRRSGDQRRRPRSHTPRSDYPLSVVLIFFAARGVLDPLTGALCQSVAVLVVVANSARILRFGTGDEAGKWTVLKSIPQTWKAEH
jgi:hypothetical protein